MLENPRVSVLMPAFNAARYIREAVESILAQTFTDFELLIIDDGSTDRTAKVVRKLAARDSRIQFRSRENRGVSATRNELLEWARGEYVAWMDADDISLPERLETQVAFLDSRPQVVAVGCFIQRLNPTGDLGDCWERPVSHEEIDSRLLRGDGSALVFGASMMRLSETRSVGQIREELRCGEDWELLLRLAELGELGNVPEVLYYYRISFDGIVLTTPDSHASAKYAILEEVWRRRGIEGSPPRQNWKHQASLAHKMEAWFWHALRNHNRYGAMRLAIRWIQLRPWSIRSYKLLYFALRGH